MPPQIDKVLLTKEQIQSRVKELGEVITDDYKGKDSLVCIEILQGSSIFTADLIRQINNNELTLDSLSVSSYGSGTQSSGTVKILKDLKNPIEGKHILIIEDIIDSGLTMKYLINFFQQQNPASIKVCSLLKKNNPEVKVQLDYCGFTIPNDAFVVGYGLDYAEKYRQLDCIMTMK